MARQLGLKFVYAERDGARIGLKLEAERLAALPEAMREELREVSESLASTAISAAIRRIAE